MYVYILGGFLGSGKTTLLKKLASMYSEKGQKVAILVNEAGKIGVDGTTLKAEGYDAIELPDGCICCSLSGTLPTALQNIKKDIGPEIIIVEPTGLALPHRVKDLVTHANLGEEDSIIIGIVDIQRFEDLIKRREDFFKNQMLGSEFIIINKCDISTPEKIEDAKNYLNVLFPEKIVIQVSTKTGENLDKVYEMMK